MSNGYDRIFDYITHNPREIDRGWMLVERDAITHSKVTRALDYIRKNAIDNVLVLDQQESQLMADEIGESTGQKIRRHIIVQLASFGFINRDTSTPEWLINITQAGMDYLNAKNKKRYFQENVVERLVFCNEQWSTSRRAMAYNDFNIVPYRVMSNIMPEINNKLYLEEMAYFVSKIKRYEDIPEVISLIRTYRGLNTLQKERIKQQLKQILARENREKFGNWRKHNKRTFEFFSMGTEFVMHYESDDPVDTFPLRTVSAEPITQTTTLMDYIRNIEEEYPYEEEPQLPRDTDINSGIEGENIIKNLLEEMNFEIRDFTGASKGFDILAMRNNHKFYVEVKSSVGRCIPALTENEYRMAERYGEVYILAIVEDVFKTPKVFFVINPVQRIGDNIRESRSLSYVIPRNEWLRIAQENV